MTQISLALANDAGQVNGHCDESFQAVLDTFVANFESRDERGGSVCINVAGETVVDLWGGKRHPKQEDEAWQEDTVSVVFSCTKAAVALCAHLLIEEGKLDVHAKVTDYWPEFGAAGKQDVTVAMMLNHSAGLPAVRERVIDGGFLDWDYMVNRLAQEEPFWSPGTRHGYHMSTFGWTVGELVRRVSDESLGEFFRNHVARPLGLDFHIGMPEEEHHRVSRMLRWAPKKGDPIAPYTQALLNDRNSIQYLALLNSGGMKTDSPASYLAEYGAGGGITNARGLAGMYKPLANGGQGFVDADSIELMQSVSTATMVDATLLSPSRFSLGFMLSMDNRHRVSGELETVLLGKHAFGHAGAGGSVGFADTQCNMGFGYTMNKMGSGILLNERGQSLVDAAYQCLGYRTNVPGYWIR